MTEEDGYRPLQFTLRSLLIFTLVASVVLSIWPSLGLVVIVLVLTGIVAGRCIRAVDRAAKSNRGKKPLLALARLTAVVIFYSSWTCILAILLELVPPFSSLNVQNLF